MLYRPSHFYGNSSSGWIPDYGLFKPIINVDRCGSYDHQTLATGISFSYFMLYSNLYFMLNTFECLLFENASLHYVIISHVEPLLLFFLLLLLFSRLV